MNENNPLVTELMARAGGASVTEATNASRAGSRGLGDLPARTSITVAAAVIAVLAIAATSWGLARHDDGKKTASPDAPESSDITFGPNQPPTTPTTTYPTFPEASTPTFPSAPFSTATFPTYPTASAPSYSSYTTPTYSYPTSTYSYSYSPSPTTTSPTKSPTTSPTSTTVTPPAPTEHKITRCGTYGSVKVTKTKGVRYELTAGNARQGRWVVHAYPRKGYVFTSGATTRWSGNVGRYYKCPSIKKVTVAHEGETDEDPWKVSVSVGVSERDKRTLTVVYQFDSAVTVETPGGAGWSCSEPAGEGPSAGPYTCLFPAAGQRPPPVFLSVTEASPTGTVTLYANKNAVDTQRFSG